MTKSTKIKDLETTVDENVTLAAETETNNKYTIEREDPFGLYYIKIEKGQLPPKLKGAWTNTRLARQAIDQYLKDNGIKTKE
jgi:hypothetical protein